MTKFLLEPYFPSVEQRLIAQAKSGGAINSLVDEEYKHRALWAHRKWFRSNFSPDAPLFGGQKPSHISCNPVATTKV